MCQAECDGPVGSPNPRQIRLSGGFRGWIDGWGGSLGSRAGHRAFADPHCPFPIDSPLGRVYPSHAWMARSKRRVVLHLYG